ncbi:MAG: ComF family protein [Dehalococcoidia bacterium]|nr:ComF family protein [Dehalococcoidia bacterium]
MALNLAPLLSGAVDLLYPPRCFGCSREGSFVCSRCRGRLEPAAEPRCDLCWAPAAAGPSHHCLSTWSLSGIRSAFVHTEVARSAAIQLKYGGVRAAAGELGHLLAEAQPDWPSEADVVVPVPLHRWRRVRRGYNQAELLARSYAREVGLPLDSSLLLRTRRTRQHAAGLSRAERLNNVAGAFRVGKGAEIEGKRIILIDDVVTTAATMSACAVALKAAGCDEVHGLSLTRNDLGASGVRDA